MARERSKLRTSGGPQPTRADANTMQTVPSRATYSVATAPRRSRIKLRRERMLQCRCNTHARYCFQ
jgi:hypothetical protein